MSEEGQDRTEPASPRRLEEARKQGQVAYSPDFLGSALLLGGVLCMLWLGPALFARVTTNLQETLSFSVPAELGPSEAATLLGRVFLQFVVIVGPILAVLFVISIGLSIVQVGFHITPERMEPDFEKLSPANGLSKLFSVAALVKGLLAIIKIAVLGVLIMIVLRSRAGVFASLGYADVPQAASLSWELTMKLALYLAIGFAIIGTTDYVYQRYRFEQSMRMTKQEVKEEAKREDGDPHMKGRIRQLQREMGRKRMLASVPKATVVVTNPIHYAVALQFIPGVMPAPKVVARGAGVLARNIIERARQFGIPVLERPVLARSLYRAVDVDQEIPPELFVAMAEVIGFVLKMRGLDKAMLRGNE
jgi:flagellar biosynthetic protein FlhB